MKNEKKKIETLISMLILFQVLKQSKKLRLTYKKEWGSGLCASCGGCG